MTFLLQNMFSKFAKKKSSKKEGSTNTVDKMSRTRTTRNVSEQAAYHLFIHRKYNTQHIWFTADE